MPSTSRYKNTHAFKRVLVANRGEIAVRIMRTLHEMEIESVAVFSDADARALHVHTADHAVHIGNSPSIESYLSIDKIIDAAKKTKADAIHPGYGFLSERANFSKACEDAGIVFIGPSPHAILTMGDKVQARQTMKKAGVPIVPGTEQPVESIKELERIANEIGFPIMLKAKAGGGGRGMRIVRKQSDLKDAFESATREATAAFGDGGVYIERFIERPRHIEVQVFGDKHGRVIHLNERECSIQRRNQKVIEEAPSIAVSEELRHEMGKVGVRAAEAVQYVGAGTIELLMDEQKRFYFLEMNTRLQVEHPVTEWITGLDLVRMQIDVASGAHIEPHQTPVPRGHSIELRIYAEDPRENYRPSPGVIQSLREPTGPGVRVDSGVYEGFEVPSFYDSMVSKVSVHAPTRHAAIDRCKRVLREYIVQGIQTNIAQLYSILEHPEFVKGNLHTGFIEEHSQDLIRFEDEPAPFDISGLSFEQTSCVAAAIVSPLQTPPVQQTKSTVSNESNNNRWRDQITGRFPF